MPRALTLIPVLLFIFSACPGFSECIPGSFWTAAWTDTFEETTYTLEAPCKVYVGIPFTITATVTDAAYPNDDVGFGWSILDNGSTVAGGGFNWITTGDGRWQRTLTQTYTGTPIDHRIEFKFTDLGEGSGAHWWGASIIGNITLDPYPPSLNTPPTVDAGENIFLVSKDLEATILKATASDADGDELLYRWLGGNTEVQSWQPVINGAATLNLAPLPIAIGSHPFTVEVTDGSSTVADTVVVSVENSAPVVVASGSGTYRNSEDISLNGSVADYDGELLTYRWREGTTLLAIGTVSTPYGGSPVILPPHVIKQGLPLGVHTLTLEVTDSLHTVVAETIVTVIDTVAPTLAPVASTSILWPPNGAMTEVTITSGARDDGGNPVMQSVLVTSNEPAETDAGGKVIADSSVASINQETGVIVLNLRSARAGNGEGRVYTVAITATDASGNFSTAELLIMAPHDMGHR